MLLLLAKDLWPLTRLVLSTRSRCSSSCYAIKVRIRFLHLLPIRIIPTHIPIRRSSSRSYGQQSSPAECRSSPNSWCLYLPRVTMLSIRWFMVLILRFIMSKVELTFHHMAGSRFLIILQSEVFILQSHGGSSPHLHPTGVWSRINPVIPHLMVASSFRRMLQTAVSSLGQSHCPPSSTTHSTIPSNRVIHPNVQYTWPKGVPIWYH